MDCADARGAVNGRPIKAAAFPALQIADRRVMLLDMLFAIALFLPEPAA
jgi:hypothetical protein